MEGGLAVFLIPQRQRGVPYLLNKAYSQSPPIYPSNCPLALYSPISTFQAFSIVSGLLLAQEAITQQHFDEYLLLPLCQLQSDKVANVRLTLARALATHVLTKPLFNSDDSRTNCIYGQELNQVILWTWRCICIFLFCSIQWYFKAASRRVLALSPLFLFIGMSGNVRDREA